MSKEFISEQVKENGETARMSIGYYCPIGTKKVLKLLRLQECGNSLGETQNQACEHGDYDILHQANSSLLDYTLDDSEDDNFKARKRPAGYYCSKELKDTAGKILVDLMIKMMKQSMMILRLIGVIGYQCDEGTAIANWQYC